VEISEDERAHLLLLRQRAEEILEGKLGEVSDLSTEDFQYLVHELQVHQAELALQNEELRRVQLELETALDRYTHLYNFAPAGYCTLNRKDRILEANQTLAVLLGVEKKGLINGRLSQFVSLEDQDKYYLYRQRAFEREQPQASVIRLVRPDGNSISVRLESRVDNNDENRLAVVLIDITRQRDLQHRLIEQREQERLRIARDLHDGPVQALIAATYTLHILRSENIPPEIVPVLEYIRDALLEQVNFLRAYAGELRPPILSTFGLAKTIRSHLEDTQQKHPGIRFHLEDAPDSPVLPDPACVTLFRIYQEGISNILRHARATEVIIRLTVTDQQAILDIQDNGVGFEIPKDWLDLARLDHLGLVGMYERMESVRGTLSIDSQPDQGTRIRVALPIQSQMDLQDPAGPVG
jgi:PAS domain S-box-containing protein